MEQIGKLIVMVGMVLLILGVAVWGLGKTGFRGLPGDIRVETEDYRFYFPIVTCIVVSIILTVIVWLWQWLRRG